MLAPILKNLCEQYGVEFKDIDVTDNKNFPIIESEGIVSIPTVKAFDCEMCIDTTTDVQQLEYYDILIR